MTPLRTALFGGSFNPLHLGHVRLAEKVLKEGLSDEVWLMISPHNPLKQQSDLLDENLRLRLAQKALSDHEQILASDFEFHLPRPSYTWQTLVALRETYPERTFSLLIGADNWLIFDRWAHYKDILATCPLIIYPRSGYPIDAETLPPSTHLLNAPLFPYSSTDIRKAVAQDEDIRHMVSESIVDDVKMLYR